MASHYPYRWTVVHTGLRSQSPQSGLEETWSRALGEACSTAAAGQELEPISAPAHEKRWTTTIIIEHRPEGTVKVGK